MTLYRTSIFIMGCLILLNSCKTDSEEALYPADENPCQPKNISYSSSISPLIKNYCATVGCHVQGGSGNGIFENYLQVKSKVDNGSFLQRVVNDQDMPPGGNLSDCEIKTIEQWILEGAQNN